MADIVTPVLTLSKIEVDETGKDGTNVRIVGVIPGIMNSILRFLGVVGSTELMMNQSHLKLRAGNMKGVTVLFVPNGSLSSVQWGYRKDPTLLFAAVVFVVCGYLVDVFSQFGGLEFELFYFWMGSLFATVLVMIYITGKTLYVEVESGGGFRARILLKGVINIDKVESAVALMLALIAKAQYSGDVRIIEDSIDLTITDSVEMPTTSSALSEIPISNEVKIEPESHVHVDDDGNTLKWNGSEWVQIY